MKLSATILLSLLLSVSCNSKKRTPASREGKNAKCLFSKPLIIGASVSAGYGTDGGGPASMIARKLFADAEIENKARNGATSLVATAGLGTEDSPSIVMGLDLFFWDAARNQCGESFVQKTKKFFETLRDSGIPLVIGKIPISAPFPTGVRMAGMRPCSKVINTLIDELCTLENNCLVYDPKDCLKAMGKAVSTDGVPYFLDQLHPSDAGNEFCADHFISEASLSDLACSSP